jgi:hypothetical protein
MSKKLKNLSSNSEMNLDQNIEELLNYKFKERVEVSNNLHHKIIETSVVKKTSNASIYWYAAAGIAILICLNFFSIRDYTKQMKNEQLKELYFNDLNNSAIF